MNKNKALNEALRGFNFAQHILREDYGMGPQDRYEDERPMRRPYPQPQDGPRPSMERPEPLQDKEEKTDVNLSKSDERIAQIREVALGGLQDYAQNVDSEAYQFYKKIWLMCDKAVSEKDTISNGNA